MTGIIKQSANVVVGAAKSPRKARVRSLNNQVSVQTSPTAHVTVRTAINADNLQDVLVDYNGRAIRTRDGTFIFTSRP